jgi:hypothetical protein
MDRIKAAYAAVRDFLIYVLTPLAFVAGYIFYLLQQKHGLEDKIGDLTRDQRQKDFEGKVREDEKDVEKSTSDYARVRDQYIAEQGAGNDVPGRDQGGGSDHS